VKIDSETVTLYRRYEIISVRISHTSWTICFKFGIEYLHVIIPSDYELHANRYSDSYVLLGNSSEILSLLAHLFSDWREIRYNVTLMDVYKFRENRRREGSSFVTTGLKLRLGV
jgi:hypothetical protein